MASPHKQWRPAVGHAAAGLLDDRALLQNLWRNRDGRAHPDRAGDDRFGGLHFPDRRTTRWLLARIRGWPDLSLLRRRLPAGANGFARFFLHAFPSGSDLLPCLRIPAPEISLDLVRRVLVMRQPRLPHQRSPRNSLSRRHLPAPVHFFSRSAPALSALVPLVVLAPIRCHYRAVVHLDAESLSRFSYQLAHFSGRDGFAPHAISPPSYCLVVSRLFSHSSRTVLRSPQSPSASRSEERRVGKECRSRWSPYH